MSWWICLSFLKRHSHASTLTPHPRPFSKNRNSTSLRCLRSYPSGTRNRSAYIFVRAWRSATTYSLVAEISPINIIPSSSLPHRFVVCACKIHTTHRTSTARRKATLAPPIFSTPLTLRVAGSLLSRREQRV